MKRQLTNWYVITGGPCSGKTTTVDLLRKRGYKTTIEEARHWLDTQRSKGRTVEEIRTNQEEFQFHVLKLQMEQESLLSPSDTVFLDRAIPDARAYYRFLGLPENPLLSEALERVFYKKVFILESLPLISDYARREDEASQETLHGLITDVYESLPFPVVHVPVLPAEDRLDLILKNL